MTKFCKCCLLALWVASAPAEAAESTPGAFLAVNWRNEDGLPHSIVNSIVQSRDGYLWIGTYVGLVRFDGVRFVHYTPRDIPELGDGRVVNLFEDREGTLWISMEGGRLVARKDGTAHVQAPGGAQPPQTILAMTQDGAGTLWFKTIAGEVGRVTPEGAEILANTGEPLSRAGHAIFCDRQGGLWVSTAEGLKRWREGQLTSPASWPPALRGPVDAAAPAGDGSVWVFRTGRLWSLNDTGLLETVEVPDGVANAVNILEDSNRRLWLAAVNGSVFCRENSGTWQEVPRESLPGANRVLYEDREGNLWRGSFGGGLARIRPRLFTVHELDEPSSDLYARSVSADSAGNVWAIVNGESIVRIPAGQQTPEKWSDPDSPAGGRTIYVDRQDNVWVGTYGGALLYQLREGTFRPVRRADNSAESVGAFFEDSHTNLWVGYTGGSGLGVLPNCAPEQWHDVQGLPVPDVRAITETPDGSLWFGTHYGGVCRLKEGRWTQFTTRDGLPSDYVRCLLVDSESTLWLGTLHGLCRWRDGRFVTITSRNGLWNDSLSHIAEDARGTLWMSSFGGIFRVSRQMLNDFADGKRDSIQCIGYGHNDGLTSLECPGACQPAGALTPDGRLWIPTVSGLVSVSTRDITESNLLPPVWIEELSVAGNVMKIHPSTAAITVPPGRRRFDFRFAALSLAAPERVLFRHRLTGLDVAWSPPEAQRTVAYSYLAPGEYTFEVVACNSDGVWNESGHSIRLVVQPFFWQRWWFKVAAGLVIGLTIAFAAWLVERWRSHLRMERLHQRHAIERERSRIAKDIHDDLGASLTQIVLLSQRVERSSHSPTEVERWLRLVPATARRTIQSLDEIVWAINARHDTLESLANYLSQFARKHLNLANIQCSLDIPMVLPDVPLSAEVRHNLMLATREAIQNIVAHSQAREAVVRLALDSECLKIVITDNGCGFTVDELCCDRSGLANMRRRVEDIGGDLELESQPGAGTTVSLSVPRSRLQRKLKADRQVEKHK